MTKWLVTFCGNGLFRCTLISITTTILFVLLNSELFITVPRIRHFSWKILIDDTITKKLWCLTGRRSMSDLVYGNCYLLTCVRQCSHGQNNGFSDELVTSVHQNEELREVSYSQFSSRKHGNVRNKTLFLSKIPTF